MAELDTWWRSQMKNPDALSCTVHPKADVRAFTRQMINTVHWSQRQEQMDAKL